MPFSTEGFTVSRIEVPDLHFLKRQIEWLSVRNEGGAAPEPDPGSDSHVLQTARGGRPPSEIIVNCLIHMIAIANSTDGLPEFRVKSDIQKYMAEWCASEGGGEPAESTLKRYSTKLWDALRKG